MAWTEFLLNATEKSAMSTILHLYHHYYIFPKLYSTLPRDLTFRVLSQPSLLKNQMVLGLIR